MRLGYLFQNLQLHIVYIFSDNRPYWTDVQRLSNEYKKDIGDILQELQKEIDQLGLNDGVTDSASEFTGSMMVRLPLVYIDR